MFRKQVVSFGVLAVLAMAAGQAHAADVPPVSSPAAAAPAATLVEWTPDEVSALNKAKQQLERVIPPSDSALPYKAHNGTLDQIPDARVIHRGDCKTYSIAFRNILVEQYGFDRNNLTAGFAYDEMNEPHMVLLIKVMDKGRQRVVVYDARFGQIMALEDLTNLGYRWWGRERSPNGVIIKWDGKPYA